MPIGPLVRRSLGPLEQTAADLYRAAFFDVDHFAQLALTLTAGHPARILEIGCGDGDVATRLTALYPGAAYDGIDLAPEPGRRYQGDPNRATFRRILSSTLRAQQPEPYELVVICDVLHHVPDTRDRVALIGDAAAMLAPGGTLLVKEWEVQPTISYRAGWAADRYVSGDRLVRYMPRLELLDIIKQGAPDLTLRHTLPVKPWRCNVVHSCSR